MHSIRLRGPWRYEVLEQMVEQGERQKDDLLAPGKQKMPADWAATLGEDFYGTVRYRRTFHQPTGLEAGQGVWLVLEGAHTRLTVALNGEPLTTGDTQTHCWPIEHLLRPTNELIIDCEHRREDEGIGGLAGEVRLEIQTVRPRPVD